MKPLESARKLPAFLAFAAVGGVGFGVNECSLFLAIHFLQMDTFTAAFLAFFVTVTFTWFGNRFLTFHENAAIGVRSMLGEWARFVGVNGIGLAANYCTFAALVGFGPKPLSSPYLALAVGSVIGLLFNFYASRRGVFRD